MKLISTYYRLAVSFFGLFAVLSIAVVVVLHFNIFYEEL